MTTMKVQKRKKTKKYLTTGIGCSHCARQVGHVSKSLFFFSCKILASWFRIPCIDTRDIYIGLAFARIVFTNVNLFM